MPANTVFKGHVMVPSKMEAFLYSVHAWSPEPRVHRDRFQALPDGRESQVLCMWIRSMNNRNTSPSSKFVRPSKPFVNKW